MKKAILWTLLVIVAVHAAKQPGPTYANLQLLGMGNAGVATHEKRHIMYLNPAGLRNIPRRFLSIGAPLIIGVDHFVFEALDFLQRNDDVFQNGLDATNPERTEAFYNDMREFDSRRITLSDIRGELGFSLFRRIGFGIYTNTETSILPDMGVFSPMVHHYASGDLVAQGALAFNITRYVSLGFAPKIMGRAHGEKTISPAAQLFEQEKTGSAADYKQNAGYGKALDFGMQIHPTNRVCLGFVARDLGKGEDSIDIKPTVHLGYAWKADTTVQNWFLKKTLLAVDIRNLGHKMPALSRINIGLQKMLSLWFVFDLDLRAGLSGGYPTTGVGFGFLKIFHFDYATFAKERGMYTGQQVERKHLLELQLGF